MSHMSYSLLYRTPYIYSYTSLRDIYILLCVQSTRIRNSLFVVPETFTGHLTFAYQCCNFGEKYRRCIAPYSTSPYPLHTPRAPPAITDENNSQYSL